MAYESVERVAIPESEDYALAKCNKCSWKIPFSDDGYTALHAFQHAKRTGHKDVVAEQFE